MSLRTKLLSFAAVLGLAGAAFGVTALSAHAQTQRLQWRVEDDQKATGEVHLNLTLIGPGHINNEGRNAPLAALQGLSAAQLSGDATQLVKFRMVRDAGTFACEGSAGHGHGSGDCAFEPGRAFAQRLSAQGHGQATDDDLLQLAMGDVGVAYLDELRREHLATAPVSELVRASHHGVSLRFLQEMAAAGYKFAVIGDLAQLRDHGVNARFIQALNEAGYRGLSAAEVTRLRDHGVSVEFITGMGAMGYTRLSADEMARLRDHGVSVGYVSALRGAGYRNLTTDDLVRLRDHGISAGYVSRVSTAGPLSAEEIIRMRDGGER